jgi:hypothetical protein
VCEHGDGWRSRRQLARYLSASRFVEPDLRSTPGPVRAAFRSDAALEANATRPRPTV